MKRKYQVGGQFLAPFTIYRPLGVGGESSLTQTSESGSSKSTKDTAAKDKLDMVKELFKSVVKVSKLSPAFVIALSELA